MTEHQLSLFGDATKLDNNKHHSSTFTDEQKLLRVLLDIHAETEIELDPMFNKGMFYKTGNIEKPKYRFDLNPQSEGVQEGDATNLHQIPSGSINTMVLDPPFLFGIHGKTEQNTCSKRYTIIPSFKELEQLYIGILQEANRVLKKKGILIFKCQDYTDSKTTMTHCFVYQWALENGFYAKDMAILIKENKIYNPKTTQRHLRKVHSYFWVFTKTHNTVNPPTLPAGNHSDGLTRGFQATEESQIPAGTSESHIPVKPCA